MSLYHLGRHNFGIILICKSVSVKTLLVTFDYQKKEVQSLSAVLRTVFFSGKVVIDTVYFLKVKQRGEKRMLMNKSEFGRKTFSLETVREFFSETGSLMLKGTMNLCSIFS